MSEMVERVAKAIYAREKLRSESMERIANQGSKGPWVSLLLPYESQNEIYRDLARAAIAANRELPDRQAHILLRTFNLFEDDLHLNAAREWHRRMIDEALK